jgi:UDP-N-acetylglucosamine--N-acetylmuramyl-(pentapeptide) pyrophosphoryl-undecaprenol N-acetylglucosamine transferase
MEAEMIQRLSIPFTSIPAAGVHGVGLKALPSNVARLLRGVAASRRILAEFKPDALLFTGGYVAVPMAVAGWKVPSLLYTPDIEPGLAIKAIARFSNCIALTAPESKAFFRFHKHLEVTGYPTRPGLTNWKKADALKHFGLNETRPVLFIFGGSKGAQSINEAVFDLLPRLLDRVQVLHITGQAHIEKAESVKAGLANSFGYHPMPYLHEDMGAAFTAADLAVCRAGASTLGELPLFGLPGILVPYPYAWRYQKVNADYLVQNGGAVMVKNEDLCTNLYSTIQNLLDSPEKMQTMSNCMRRLAAPDAAENLSDLLCNLAGSQKDPLS